VTPDRFEDAGPMLLAGLRRRHSMATAASGIAEQWREFLLTPHLPNRIGSDFYGVVCGSDGANLEYMCAVEVQSFADLSPNAGKIRVPAQHYAIFAPPDGSPVDSTWREILAWLAAGPYESAHKPDFERYTRAPLTNADLVGVEIWVGVVRRSAE
jgi:predicted transcriptional regulator YdeE